MQEKHRRIINSCTIALLLNVSRRFKLKYLAWFLFANMAGNFREAGNPSLSLNEMSLCFVQAPRLLDFKIGHYGRLGRLDRCHVTQNTRDLLPSSFWDGMFSRVSRREDNGETDKSSCILIVTFLLKLSSQWIKYALACVYIDLPIGEMKKKRKCLSSFIT